MGRLLRPSIQAELIGARLTFLRTVFIVPNSVQGNDQRPPAGAPGRHQGRDRRGRLGDGPRGRAGVAVAPGSGSPGRHAGAVAVLVLRLQERDLRRDVRPGRAGLPRLRRGARAHRRPARGAAGRHARLRRVLHRGPGPLPAAVPADHPGLRAVARDLRDLGRRPGAGARALDRDRPDRPEGARPADRHRHRPGRPADLQRPRRGPVEPPRRRGHGDVLRPRQEDAPEGRSRK